MANACEKCGYFPVHYGLAGYLCRCEVIALTAENETYSEQMDIIASENKRLTAERDNLLTKNKNLRGEVKLWKNRVDEAAKVVAEFEELKAEVDQHRWIPVNERLPLLKKVGEDDCLQSDYVRITDGEQVVDAYYYDYTKREAKPNYTTGKGWYCYGMRKTNITHWKMEILPEALKAEDEKES